MTGNKQNPTIWLAHLRCTDRRVTLSSCDAHTSLFGAARTACLYSTTCDAHVYCTAMAKYTHEHSWLSHQPKLVNTHTHTSNFSVFPLVKLQLVPRRHRIGDNTRGITLARWGGLGGHRYQVGFSGGACVVCALCCLCIFLPGSHRRIGVCVGACRHPPLLH